MATKTTNSLQSLLTKANKTFDQAVEKAKSSGYADWPDGKYIGKFIGFEIKESSGGNWGVLFQYNVLEGEKENSIKYNWVNLMDYEDADQFNTYLLRDLEKLSHTDAEELDMLQLETILADAVEENQVWEFTLKSKAGKDKDGNSVINQNFYLNKEIEDYQEEEAPTTKPTTSAKKPAAVPKTAPVTTAKVKAKPAPEPEPEEEEDEEASFEEGQEVSYTVTTGKGRAKKTEEFEGIIVSVDEEEETCEIGTGEFEGKGRAKKEITVTVPFSDITPAEIEEEEEETEDEEGESEVSYEVGEEITYTVNGKEFTGTVTEVDEDTETLTTTTKVGRKSIVHTIDFTDVVTEEEETEEDDEESDDEDEEEGAELEVGSTVEYVDPKTKKEVIGKVTAIDEKSGIAKVKVGAVTKPIAFDELSLITEK